MKYLWVMLLLAGPTTWAQTKVPAGETEEAPRQIDFLHGPTWDVGMVVDDVEGFITARHEWIYAQVDRIFADPTHPLHREAADGTLTVRGRNMPELIDPAGLLAWAARDYATNDTLKGGMKDVLIGAGFPMSEMNNLQVPQEDRLHAWIERYQASASEPFVPAFEPNQVVEDQSIIALHEAKEAATRQARKDWSIFFLNRLAPRARVILMKTLSGRMIHMKTSFYDAPHPVERQISNVRHWVDWLKKQTDWSAQTNATTDGSTFYRQETLFWASSRNVENLLSQKQALGKREEAFAKALKHSLNSLKDGKGAAYATPSCDGSWDWRPHVPIEPIATLVQKSSGIVQARVVGESPGLMALPTFVTRTLVLEPDAWIREPTGITAKRLYMMDPHASLNIEGFTLCGDNPASPRYQIGDTLVILAEKPLDDAQVLLLPPPDRVIRVREDNLLEGTAQGISGTLEELVETTARHPFEKNYIQAGVR